MRTVIPWFSMTNKLVKQWLVGKFDLIGMIDDDETITETSARTIVALDGAVGAVSVSLTTVFSPGDYVQKGISQR